MDLLGINPCRDHVGKPRPDDCVPCLADLCRRLGRDEAAARTEAREMRELAMVLVAHLVGDGGGEIDVGERHLRELRGRTFDRDRNERTMVTTYRLGPRGDHLHLVAAEGAEAASFGDPGDEC